MSSISLNLGIESLLAAQTALDTVGHNLANANTPGYSRQTVQLVTASATLVGGRLVGNGVRADRIVSVRDLLTDKRILTQIAAVGRLDTRASGLADVESLFGEPNAGSLSNLLSGFFGSVSGLSANVGDATLRRDAVRSAGSVAERFQSLRTGLTKLRDDATKRIQDQVSQVNALTGDIATLSRSIGAAEVDGTQANDLRDSRDEKLRALAAIVDVTVVEHANGTLDVSSQGQILVAGTSRFDLRAEKLNDGTVGVTVRGNGHPLPVHGGSLGGLLATVNEDVPQRLADLDELAHSFVHAMNSAHATGVPLAGPFQSLESSNAIVDSDDDGVVDDELLASAGLPFPIEDGALVVNVTNRTTGDVQTTRIPIDPQAMTVGDLASAIAAIPGLDTSITDDGHLAVRAAHGFGFDFSARSFPTTGTLGGSNVAISGRYTGASASDLTFRPRTAGEVGATPNLLVDAYDANGSKVATFDVGAGYVPGSDIDLGNGLKANFGLGSIATTDSFALHAVASGDTSGVLAAFGLNELFTGSDAGDIAVSERIDADPTLLAAGSTLPGGDGGALSAMLDASQASLDDLAGSTFSQYVGSVASGIGSDRASAESARDTEQALHDSLVAQRDAQSGVNSDEELVNMLRFQQSYQASAQFIQVVNSLTETLLQAL